MIIKTKMAPLGNPFKHLRKKQYQFYTRKRESFETHKANIALTCKLIKDIIK